MADSAELSIDKALEDLNVSKEKQKIILIGSRKQLWRSFLLDMTLWQFCPQGSAKAQTEDNSWLLNSEGKRNGIFVEGRRQTLLYCYKWGQGKQFILRKIRKTTANKLIIAQIRFTLTSKETWNKNGSKSNNHKSQKVTFWSLEMNIHCLRGPLSWGDKSGWHLKNHGSLAEGISISNSLRCLWQLRHQISLHYHMIAPATQATNSLAKFPTFYCCC